ncbi:complement C1q tumor necrosis factor-related protein 3-like [Crassostrea virginica]
MKTSCGFLIALLFNVYTITAGKDAKPVLEEFKKDYSSIMEACKAVGFVRDNCSTRDGNRKVAFTAAVTSPSNTWNSGNLIFNRIISNLGNGYNRRTGVFTAPVAGTYVFYVSVNEYSKLGIGLEIVLNNVSKVRLLGYSDSVHQTGTNMVVLNLQKNDGVCVRRYWGKGYYTYSDTP